MSADRLVVGLIGSCHPVPTVAVTTITTILVAAAGNTWGVVAIAALAVLTGQLSIGWSNDAIDASRDRHVDRRDKPVTRGLVSERQVWIAAASAAVATVPLSLLLGWGSGVVHLSGVACGWLYNTALKSTPFSPAPFFVAFGGLPAVATLALPTHPWPPAWAMLAGGLIGVAAHFGNVLPDFDQDARTAIRGLPHRLGRLTAALTATGLALAAAVIAAAGSAASEPTIVIAVVAAGLLSGLTFVAVRRNPASEAAFYCPMLVSAIGIALIAASGSLA